MLDIALEQASRVPYNNASDVLRLAGESLPPIYGGSCIFQLSHLLERAEELGVNTSNTVFVRAIIHNPRDGHEAEGYHYAAVMDGFYVDPFVNLVKPISLANVQPTELSPTLLNQSYIRVDNVEFEEDPVIPNGFDVSVLAANSRNPAPGVVQIYNYTEDSPLECLPTIEEITLLNRPNYKMHFVTLDGTRAYSLWYYKKDKRIIIRYIEPSTGYMGKTDKQSKAFAIKQIESTLNLTMTEIEDVFKRAVQADEYLRDMRARLISID